MARTTPGRRSGGSRGSSEGYTALDRLINPESGVTLASTKVTEQQVQGQQTHNGPKVYNETLIRILPHVEEGQIVPMIVDPNAAYPEEMLSGAFMEVDVLEGCGDKNATVICGLWDTDVNGNTGWKTNDGSVVNDWYPPGQQIILPVSNKLREAYELKKAGLPTGVPPQWEKYFDMDFAKCRCTYKTPLAPEGYNNHGDIGITLMLMKGYMYVENGVRLEQPKYVVFPVRRSARADFIRAITTPHFMDQPVSEQNNKIGDFMSPNGNMLRLTASVVNDRTAYRLELSPTNLPLPAEHIVQAHKSWDDILINGTVEKVIEIMLEVYGPEVVDYGLRNSKAYADFIPPEVRGASASITDWTNAKQTRELIATGQHPLQLAGHGHAPQQYSQPAPQQQQYAQPQQQQHSTNLAQPTFQQPAAPAAPAPMQAPPVNPSQAGMPAPPAPAAAPINVPAPGGAPAPVPPPASAAAPGTPAPAPAPTAPAPLNTAPAAPAPAAPTGMTTSPSSVPAPVPAPTPAPAPAAQAPAPAPAASTPPAPVPLPGQAQAAAPLPDVPVSAAQQAGMQDAIARRNQAVNNAGG